jgi:anti-sigma regulatory factor (Ser/Thr protein kinase)
MVERCKLRKQIKKQLEVLNFQFFCVSLSPDNLCDMLKSLSARLTFRIMAVVLVMMVVIAGVVNYTVREYMLDEAKERYLGFLLENRQEIRRRLSDVYVAAENNVDDIERDIDNPDRMFDHMERIVRQNRPIVCCALLFKHDYYPSKGKVFVPCARRDSTDRLVVSRIDSTYNSYFYGEWFQNQLKADHGCWTKPYFESQLFAGDEEPRLLTTYTVPIHDHDGHPVALLCADMSLEWLRGKMVEDIRSINNHYEKGCRHQSYFFIIDKDGNYVVHPNKELMLTPFDEKVGKAMSAHRGTCKTEVDGVKSWLYYRSIKFVKWTMVIVAPEDALLANARGLNIIILLVMILGLVVIYFICRRLIKGIADPVAMQKANLEHELKIANGIQMAMLPKTLNSPSGAVDLYAALTPARDVGGDLYDFFLRDNRLFFCIGDVSGKGVPAALMMAVVRAMFRSETRRADSAAAIVDTMNRSICEESTAGYFVTMFVGILDLTTGHLDYCNAGHEQPIVTGQPLEVILNLPVGALSDWNYEGQQTQLQPGDILFLYTDGLSEAKNTAGELFGRKHVKDLATEHTTDSPQQLVELMETEVHRYVDDAEQSDDITLLAIRWQSLGGSHSSRLSSTSHLSMSASMDDIGALEPFVTQAAQQAGLDDRETKRLRLAVEEAVANVINHGQATAITLLASVEDNQLVLTVDDDGLPFDPTADSTTDFTVPADQRPPGGLGIMYLHKMTDGLDYQRVDGHNVLRIIKTIHKK